MRFCVWLMLRDALKDCPIEIDILAKVTLQPLKMIEVEVALNRDQIETFFSPQIAQMMHQKFVAQAVSEIHCVVEGFQKKRLIHGRVQFFELPNKLSEGPLKSILN